MTVYVEFEKRAVPQEGKGKTGKPKYVDYAIFLTDRFTQTPVAWERLPDMEKERFQEEYDAWKRGEEAPLNGFDIRKWPVLVDREIVELLVRNNIRTVEDLADANDSAMDAIGAGARSWQQDARDWLDAANDTGRVAEELSESRNQMADMQREIDDLKATLAAVRTEDAPKAKRTRKQPAEATA